MTTNVYLVWIMVWTYGTWAEMKKARLSPPPSSWWLLLDLAFAVLFLIAVIVTIAALAPGWIS